MCAYYDPCLVHLINMSDIKIYLGRQMFKYLNCVLHCRFRCTMYRGMNCVKDKMQ